MNKTYKKCLRVYVNGSWTIQRPSEIYKKWIIIMRYYAAFVFVLMRA